MAICGCKGCAKPVLALGMCVNHWRMNRLYGSPFASKSHSGAMQGLPAPERFQRQHKKGESCWEWTASLDTDGYGKFRGAIFGAVYNKAHRYSWALHNGEAVPANLMVCHSCDNRKCVNPAHLWLGTNEDNMKDKIAKGRQRVLRGESHPDALLTEDQVRAILADARPYTAISADYGVHTQTIASIKSRKSWAHVEVDHVAKAPRASNRKGKGEKINEDIVREIIHSTTPGSELAERYGVSRQLITNIRKRRVWKHVS